MTAPRLTTRGQVFLAVGLLLTVLAMVLGYPDLTRVGVLLTLLPVLSLAASWSRPPRLAVRRTVLPPALWPGEAAAVRVEVRNEGRRRTPVQLGVERIDGLGAPRRFVVPRLFPGERCTVRYEVTGTRRGRYRLGPCALRQHDPFGLTSRAAALPGRQDLVVLPRVEDLGHHRTTAHGLGSTGHAPRMVTSHGEDDASIRAFRQGDDLRRVHWPTTAHRGELMVRHEDRPTRRRAVLLLDTRRGVHRGTGETGSLEWAVSAVASVAMHLTERGFALHLVTTGPPAAPDERPEGLRHLLGRLAEVSPAETADLGEALHAAQALAGGGGLLVAVTTDHDRGDLDRVAAVRPPGAVGVLLLLRAASFAGQAPEGAAPLVPGWRSSAVSAGDSVRTAWDRATQDTAVAVGP